MVVEASLQRLLKESELSLELAMLQLDRQLLSWMGERQMLLDACLCGSTQAAFVKSSPAPATDVNHIQFLHEYCVEGLMKIGYQSRQEILQFLKTVLGMRHGNLELQYLRLGVYSFVIGFIFGFVRRRTGQIDGFYLELRITRW